MKLSSYDIYVFWAIRKDLLIAQGTSVQHQLDQAPN